MWIATIGAVFLVLSLAAAFLFYSAAAIAGTTADNPKERREFPLAGQSGELRALTRDGQSITGKSTAKKVVAP